MSHQPSKSNERFWKMLADNAFVKSINSITDEVKEYPPAITDMEAIVAIHGEFDKHAIEEWLDAEREKAVEEALKKIKEGAILFFATHAIDLDIQEKYFESLTPPTN